MIPEQYQQYAATAAGFTTNKKARALQPGPVMDRAVMRHAAEAATNASPHSPLFKKGWDWTRLSLPSLAKRVPPAGGG